MLVIGLTKPSGAVKAKSSLSARGTIRKAQSREFQSTSLCWDYAEHKCWDPKDGELCMARLNARGNPGWAEITLCQHPPGTITMLCCN